MILTAKLAHFQKTIDFVYFIVCNNSRFPSGDFCENNRTQNLSLKGNNSLNDSRSGSRTAAKSKMKRIVIIVNGFQGLTIIKKCSILDVAAVLDTPLDFFQIVLLSFHSLERKNELKQRNQKKHIS